MKLLGRVIYGFFVVLIGIQMFSCSRNTAYSKAIEKIGNEAYENGQFNLVNELFEYYKEDAFYEDTITIVDGDTRFGVEDKDIVFDIYVFLQSEIVAGSIGKKAEIRNSFTVLVVDLSMKDPDAMLNIIIKKNGKEDILEQTLYRREKNWYIQQFLFEGDVDQMIISHSGPSSAEPIILFNSENNSPIFLTEDDHNIEYVLTEELELADYGIVKRSEDPLKGMTWNVWLTMAIYIAVASLVTFVIFFKKTKESPFVKKTMAQEETKTEPKAEDKENINIKKIQEVEYRDDIENKK